MNNKRLYRISFVMTIAVMLLTACAKNEEEAVEDIVTGGNEINPGMPGAYGCYVQNMIASDLDPQYIFHYDEFSPYLLKQYEWYNSTTGNINETYVLHYILTNTGVYLLDYVNRYIGEVSSGSQFYESTVFEYYVIDSLSYTIDGADVFSYDASYPNNSRLKGKIYYDYDNNDNLSGIRYYDEENEDNGIINDNYEIVYLTDIQDRLREMHYYDYNGNETYYEIHTPSTYYQPTQLSFTTHPYLSYQTRFAPDSSTYGYPGIGTYTYDWHYQVNSENFIVEQSWNDGTNDNISSLFTYECYE